MTTHLTLRDLLASYPVRIPSIQRDYVQGRRNAEVERARESLLADMESAVAQRTPLSLNFVYGYIDGDSAFVPLDGQQRLTTLFLMHWFAAIVGRHSDRPARLQQLTRFTYATRASSDAFLRRLTDDVNASELARAFAAEPESFSFTAQIRDKAWYRSEWEYDPTIESCLAMLDRIREVFTDRDLLIAAIWGDEAGTDPRLLHFEWLKTDNLGDPNALYIKMNARGRPLTELENLKAELEGVCPREMREPFARKFDQDWSDYFWSTAGPPAGGSPESAQAAFMEILHVSLFNRWCELNAGRATGRQAYAPAFEKIHSLSDLRTLRDYLASPVAGEDRLPLETLATSTWFEQMEQFLDAVSKSEDVRLREIVERATARTRTRHDELMLHAAVVFFSASVSAPVQDAWDRWYSVLSNLSSFSLRYQGYNQASGYVNAISRVSGLAPHAHAIDAAIATADDPGTGFMDEQVRQVAVTSSLRISSPDWAAALDEAEAIPYFMGWIGFLVEFAGVGQEGNDSSMGALVRFRQYTALVEEIVSAGLLDTTLLRAALLTQGDPALPWVAKTKSYLVLDDRDIDWRALVRMRPQVAMQRGVLHRLLDEILTIRETHVGVQIVECLRQIVDSYVPDPDREDWWAEFFIEQPERLDSLLGRFRQWALLNDQAVYLPVGSNSWLNGHNHELLTSVLRDRLEAVGVATRPLVKLGYGEADFLEYPTGVADTAPRYRVRTDDPLGKRTRCDRSKRSSTPGLRRADHRRRRAACST